MKEHVLMGTAVACGSIIGFVIGSVIVHVVIKWFFS